MFRNYIVLILDIIQNPEEWRKRGMKGRKHVLTHHAWDKRIADGMAIYSKLTNICSAKEAA